MFPATFDNTSTTPRGLHLLHDSDGFIYTRLKSRDTSTSSFWRCAKKSSSVKCPVTLTLNTPDNTLTFGEDGPHNHPSPYILEERDDFINMLKMCAGDAYLDHPIKWLVEWLTPFLIERHSPEVTLVMPKPSTLTQILQKARRESPKFKAQKERHDQIMKRFHENRGEPWPQPPRKRRKVEKE